eukprot:Plantae.Rhodophyta-Palmaria_palmata.ctg32078.p1 GENE.Plantae.Rhodophyta-Palmaria_palmata.ctg32078~~Plantae.Rhodophyta-Palmaria_palmata.ctg32078.p1  ORF type:complete len:127 (+),score=13.56 Plantae.Rhodophyta-Palmaria_palmata.ctg32078:164-544(+)
MGDALEHCSHNDDWTAVSVDARDAFHMMFRAAIVAGINAHAPSPARWMNALYATGTPSLKVWDAVLGSGEGTQQGDRVIMLVFALVIQPIMDRTDFECDLLINRWYADDSMVWAAVSERSKGLWIW